MKKFVAVFLAALLVLTALPVGASARDIVDTYIDLPVFTMTENWKTIDCTASLVTLVPEGSGYRYQSITPITLTDGRGEIRVWGGNRYCIVETGVPAEYRAGQFRNGYNTDLGVSPVFELAYDSEGGIICTAVSSGKTTEVQNVFLLHPEKADGESLPLLNLRLTSTGPSGSGNSGVFGFQYRITGLDDAGTPVGPVQLSTGAGTYEISLRPGVYYLEETASAAGYLSAPAVYIRLGSSGGNSLITVLGLQATGSSLYIRHAADPNAPAIPDVDTSSGSLANFQKRNSYAQGQFSDVAADAWYVQNVEAAFEYGLMQGSDDGGFHPGDNLYINQTLAIACRLHNIYYGGSGTFTQGNPWYQVYVDYALKYGIIQAGVYNPTAVANRAQFASILSAALPAAALSPINSVTAVPDVPASAPYYEAVLRLYNAGILQGVDEYGTFLPQNSISRSEVAAMITRIADVGLRKRFTLGKKTLAVNVKVEGNGTVTGAGNYAEGEYASLQATPAAGAKFDGWYGASGKKLSESLSIKVQVQSGTNLNLTAKFVSAG